MFNNSSYTELFTGSKTIKQKPVKLFPAGNPYNTAKALLYKKANIALCSLRHESVPLYIKLLLILLVAYIVSPIDLIPDFIPVLGLLDEIILVPIAMSFIVQLIPCEIYNELNANELEKAIDKKIIYFGGILVISIWLILLGSVYHLWILMKN